MSSLRSDDDAATHPRPLLRRAWETLDGPWGFSLDPDAGWQRPAAVPFEQTIEVPFAPETPASGIHAEGRFRRCWYRRRVRTDAPDGSRPVLHLGAVDRHATIWVDGAAASHHTGGYTPISVDLSDYVEDGEVEIAVQADDDPADLEVPRGKQDWRDVPHAIWYPRTTGLWRTVWLEHVPHSSIGELRWTPDPATMTVHLEARLHGPSLSGARLAVRLSIAGRLLVDDVVAVTGPRLDRSFTIGDGGFDDRALVWSPGQPRLLDADVALLDGRGDVVDEARSYTALRSVDVSDGSVLLNGRPHPLRLVLDQGYWPESGATPPSADALRRDLELTRALGFNGARKHQKTEDPRYFAWADRMGMLVWVEMPSAYRTGVTAASNLIREWEEIVRTYQGHPSVIAWVPFNESWGVRGLESDPRQRALLSALASTADALDGTRPVSTNDGWETIGGSIVGIHDYTQDPAVLARRYATRDAVAALLTGRRWDGKLADLERRPPDGRAVILSEFGGVALSDDTDERRWGYVRASSADDLLRRYRDQWQVVHESEVLAGACWTQLTDTYQEVNGLLRADRTPKASIEELAAATRGR